MEPKRFSSAREAALQSGQADGPQSATAADDAHLDRSTARMLTQMTGKPVDLTAEDAEAKVEAADTPNEPSDPQSAGDSLNDDDAADDGAADDGAADDESPAGSGGELGDVGPAEDVGSADNSSAQNSADLASAPADDDEGGDVFESAQLPTGIDFLPEIDDPDASPTDDDSFFDTDAPSEEPDSYFGQEPQTWRDASLGLELPAVDPFSDGASTPRTSQTGGAANNSAADGSDPADSDPNLSHDAQSTAARVSLSVDTQMSLEAAQQQMTDLIGAVESLARNAAFQMFDAHQQDLSAYRALTRAALGER